MTQEVTMSLLIKLGSIIVHEDERRAQGHEFDDAALRTLREDAEVRQFLADMDDMACLPLRRDGVRYLSVEKS